MHAVTFMMVGLFTVLGCSSTSNNGSSATGGNGSNAGNVSVGGNASVGSIGDCTIFPSDNPWNQDVSGLALNANSATYVSNMSPSRGMHPDWGDWSTDHYGIPFSSGTGATPEVIKWSASWVVLRPFLGVIEGP